MQSNTKDTKNSYFYDEIDNLPPIMKKIVLITGATSGIGEASAKLFAANGYDIIITGRRAERLKALKEELKDKFGCKVHVMSFDIKDARSVKASLEAVPEHFRRIDVLLNNAGKASDFIKIQDGDIANWDEVIDTNVKGLIYMTRIISPMMIKQGGGHIINIGSIAGTEPYEYGNVYCATKHAVHGFSKSIRIDLLGTGVRVTEIRPGKVWTEFSLVRFRGDKEKADKVYEGYRALRAEDIAETILWAANQPPHVNIDEVVITPAAQANSYYQCKEEDI